MVGLASVLAAYSLCGFLAFVALPLGGGAFDRGSIFCLVPAVALGGVLLGGAWRTTWTLWAGASASRRLATKIEGSAIPHPPRLRSAVVSAGLSGKVDLVDDEETLSFAYGMLAPRVAIGRDFLERLSDEELRATLTHERYHVRNLDPLRSLIAAAIGKGFFLLPYLGVLRVRYEAGRELAADLFAERTCGRRALLAALVKALDSPQPEQPVSSSLAAPALLDARVQRLETGRSPKLPRLDLPALAWSVYGIATLAFLFVLALLGLGGTDMLQRTISTELDASTNVLGLLCLVPVTIPALALWRLGRRTHSAPEAVNR